MGRIRASFGNTPQAKNDVFTAVTTGISEDSQAVVLLDVMANDLGGTAKTLYSLDDASSVSATTKTYAPADLLARDFTGVINRSKFGAEISITAGGMVAYNMNTTAFMRQFQSLAAGEIGYDTFTYAIRLGNGTLSWATATVEVAGRNDAPIVTAQLANAVEDGQSVSVDALATASDVDMGTILKVVEVPAMLPAGVTYDELTRSFSLNPADAAYDHLAQGSVEQVVVSYAVSDGITSTPTSITYTITGTNDGPVAVADLAAGTENQALLIDVLANDTDLDDGHVFTLNAASAPEGKGTASVVDNQLQFNPGTDFDHLAAGVTETVTLSYEMQDEQGAISTSTVEVTITGTNDGPVAVADVAAGTENETLTIDVLANDTDLDDGHLFTLNSVTAPNGKGTAGVVDNKLHFTPGTDFDHLAAGVSETVTLRYEMQDEQGAISTCTVEVTITGTNDGPVAVADQAAGTENQTLLIDVLANDTDLDDGHLFTLNAASAPEGKGTASVVDNQLQFNPGTDFDHLAAGVTETVTLSYEMQDEQGAISTSTVEVTITGTNDGPVAVADLAEGTENQALTIDVLANDTDLDDGHVFTLNAVAAPEGKGIATVAENKLQFNPGTAFDHLAAGVSETVMLSYEMQDEQGAVSTSTVEVTITGTNDAPVVSAALETITDEDAAPYAVNLLTGASDIDEGAMLRVGTVAELNGKGGWSLEGNTLTINPGFYDHMNDGDFETLKFQYQVIDEHGTAVAQQLTVGIEGITDAPSLSVATSAGERVNEIQLEISSQPARDERVALTFGKLPSGARVFDQNRQDVTMGVSNYNGSQIFTVVLPQGADINTDLDVVVTGYRTTGEEIGHSVQSVELLYDVSSSTELVEFTSYNQNMWGNFNGYIGWHEYIPLVGGAPEVWNEATQQWDQADGAYWRSGKFTLMDVHLDANQLREAVFKIVKDAMDAAWKIFEGGSAVVDTVALAAYDTARGVFEAAKNTFWSAADAVDQVALKVLEDAKIVFNDAVDTFKKAMSTIDAGILDAFNNAKIAYEGAKKIYQSAESAFKVVAQGAFNFADGVFKGLESAFNWAYNDWVAKDQAYWASGWKDLFGTTWYDPIKWLVAADAWTKQAAVRVALEAGKPVYELAKAAYAEAKALWDKAVYAFDATATNLYNKALQDYEAAKIVFNEEAAKVFAAAEKIYLDAVQAYEDVKKGIYEGAEATFKFAEGEFQKAQDTYEAVKQGIYDTAKVAYDSTYASLSYTLDQTQTVDFAFDLELTADLFAQAGLQVDFVLDLGSVDTTLDYELTANTHYNHTTDMLAITPMMTSMTTGQSVAFETISPNVKVLVTLLYDVGVDIEVTADGLLKVGNQVLFDLTPNSTSPAHVTTTISTNAWPELPGNAFTDTMQNSGLLDLLREQTPGKMPLLDFDSARDLGGPFELEFIDQLLSLVEADGILSISLAFPTVETEGTQAVYSADFFKEGGLVSVDFSEILNSLINLAQAKLDYSPEFRALTGVGSLGNVQNFDQIVTDAMKTFGAVLADLLDGQTEAVPMFLLDGTDQNSQSLVHINTFGDAQTTSTLNPSTAKFGFYTSYGESLPVLDVSIDVDQAVAFIVNEITEAVVAAVSAGGSVAATEAIPTINPLNISFGVDEVLEMIGLPTSGSSGGNGGSGGAGNTGVGLDIADIIDFNLTFEAADIDVNSSIDFSQEFSLSIDDMSYLVTLEDGVQFSFKASDQGELLIANASSHDQNHDGMIDYSFDIVPTAMFSNDTEVGLNFGYVLDLLKAEFSAGIKLPLGDLLGDILPGVSLDIPLAGIDIALGPMLRVQGDLDVLDVDVFESRFALDAGSDHVELKPIGISESTMTILAA